MKKSCFLVAFAAALFFPGRAAAQVDPFEFEVYPYHTLERGKGDVESLNSIALDGYSKDRNGEFASENMWRTSLELVYGISDRIEAAAYLDMAKPDGHDFWYAGSKYRLRGRLFDQGTLPVDLGWYAELDWHRKPQFDDADLDLELRPIIEKDFGPIQLMLNPKFERPIAANNDWEFGYAAGLFCRCSEDISPGVEFYGGMGQIDDVDPSEEQQHYIFPALHGELGDGWEYNVGAGFGLTDGSDDFIVKVNLEYETFLGTVVGPSDSSSWFW